MRIETFYKTCSRCGGLGLESQERLGPCPVCRGFGLESEEYKRFCSYETVRDCEWGGDCKHCEDAEPVLKY